MWEALGGKLPFQIGSTGKVCLDPHDLFVAVRSAFAPLRNLPFVRFRPLSIVGAVSSPYVLPSTPAARDAPVLTLRRAQPQRDWPLRRRREEHRMVGFESFQAVGRPLLFNGWPCIAREGAGVGFCDAQD